MSHFDPQNVLRLLRQTPQRFPYAPGKSARHEAQQERTKPMMAGESQ